ncbi:MAG: formylglycine-generating enzyme family protein, partial [Candidatus Electrothrix sp. AR4]|nr:formylglycine-generating enzyme family protein [Candidatus Electrothrix sp. AR4]
MPALFLRLRRGCIWGESEELIRDKRGDEHDENEVRSKPVVNSVWKKVGKHGQAVTFAILKVISTPKRLFFGLVAAGLLVVGGILYQMPETGNKEKEETTTDSITGMEFVSVPSGCFMMGSPPDEEGRRDDEGPVHKVCVDGFWIGKYEVTQEQWQKITGKNPAEFQRGDNYPVENVSRNDAQKFLAELSKKSGRKYRLPTEAEWEYACRAGGSGRYGGGDDLDAVAWYSVNSGYSTHPVGGKQANDFGLHDMSGNVWEWCGDWYKKDYYSSSPQDNPTGPASGTQLVLRGGSWNYHPDFNRCSIRKWDIQSFRNDLVGFRVVFSQALEEDTATEPPTDSEKIVTDQVAGMEFVSVPGGCFKMGASYKEHEQEDNDHEVPRHKVCVDSFSMGKYEVTQGQWVKIMSGMEGHQCEFRKGDEYPMEKVSWNEVQEFIVELNKQSGREYRLPTEAEWEYAARGGTTTARWWGDDISCSQAMYSNSKGNGNDSCMEYTRSERAPAALTPYSTAPVGSYPHNQFGLYDMLGNVSEFCSNWLSPYPLKKHNPQGPAKGEYRVFRGGSLNDNEGEIRSALRYGLLPHERDGGIGFRLVLPVQQSHQTPAAGADTSIQKSGPKKSDIDSDIESISLTDSHKIMTDPVIGMEFVSIPGGCFQMGSLKSERK